MILLDTHIWVWWINSDARFTKSFDDYLAEHRDGGIAISAISCWEVAKLCQYGKLQLSVDVGDWLNEATSSPLQVLPLSAEVAVESTRLPPGMNRDPSDQIIVATARVHDCTLLTMDRDIRAYAHVKLGP